MSRLSFRPRPLDIHKKLPIVKSIKDLDLEDARAIDGDCENLQVLTPAKKSGVGSEIPTPQYVVVESYERDYTRSFVQPPSYIRGRPARSDNVEFCEYDLDSDDEHWLLQFNSERKILPPEKFETMLYKLEILDHKAAERQGTLVPVLGSPISVVLSRDSAIEVLKQVINRPAVLGAVFDYWRNKREIWQKPVLRRLQPPPPVNDTNPFNVFRPREKIHRPHTRRMQRRENDIQSFEKLKQVRYVIERSLVLVRAIQQREEKKRELVEVEANTQRLQLKLKAASQYAQYEALRLGEDSPGVLPSKFARSEDGHRFMSKGEHVNGNNFNRSMSMELTPSLPYDSTTVHDHQDVRRPRRRPRFPPARNPSLKEKMKKLEPMEPVFLFTKPLDATKLAGVGITTVESTGKYRLAGRVGRGGRLVFDRWNPLFQPDHHHFHHSGHGHHHHHHHHVMSIGAPPRFGARPGGFHRRTHVVEPLALPVDTILTTGPPTTSAAAAAPF